MVVMISYENFDLTVQENLIGSGKRALNLLHAGMPIVYCNDLINKYNQSRATCHLDKTDSFLTLAFKTIALKASALSSILGFRAVLGILIVFASHLPRVRVSGKNMYFAGEKSSKDT